MSHPWILCATLLFPIVQAQFSCGVCPGGVAGAISNCADAKIADPSATSGVFDIEVTAGCCIQVYCDMETWGGGWTIFQKRHDGSANFIRNYADYNAGFGAPLQDYWLGLANIRSLTWPTAQDLLVILEEGINFCRYEAHYASFYLGPAPSYVLNHGAFLQGVIGNYLSYNGYAFTVPISGTQYSGCASTYQGGWWYAGCHKSQLNGVWYDHNCIAEYAQGPQWSKFGYYRAFRSTRMMIRPPGFPLHDPSAHDFCPTLTTPVCTNWATGESNLASV